MSVPNTANLWSAVLFNPPVCGFENLRHLVVDSLQIDSVNGLVNLEILELVCINNGTPLQETIKCIQEILGLPKLKELHIRKISADILSSIPIFEAIRQAKETKNFKFFYEDVEFCEELFEGPHYFSPNVFTEYQLFFLQRHWSRLSSRPFYLTRLHFVGDLFKQFDDARFLSNKLPFVVEIEISQENFWVNGDTFISQNKMASFLRHFPYLQTLFLEVCSVDQHFYDSLPDLHPYLQRLYFGILPKTDTFESQMQLPDLNFLSRFKYLFAFDSHHLTKPEDSELLSVEDTEKIASLMPTLDEHQKQIIDRIQKRGLELAWKKNSKPGYFIPDLLPSSNKILDDRFGRDVVFVPLHIFLNEEHPCTRYYASVGRRDLYDL